MKRITGILAIGAIALAASAFASGEKGNGAKMAAGAKCSASTQDCLNHMSAMKGRGWMGIEMDHNAEGAMFVKKVVPGSPAEKAGFAEGDVLVALNGASMSDESAVAKARGEWAVGQEVAYTIKRGGEEKSLTVALAAMPEDVYDRMVGHHMISDHMQTAAAEKSAK